jgi:lysophospholipase L1-like esterase
MPGAKGTTVLVAAVMALSMGIGNAVQGKALKPDSVYRPVRGGLANSYSVFTQEKRGRVAFLGGSITQNPGWRDSVCAYLQRRFPETRFTFINAGIASTGSVPGAFRLAHDVLEGGPVDLLFEEAAVNDATNGTSGQAQIRGMEGIVRHALTAGPATDIVLLYFSDPEKMAAYRRGEAPPEIRNHDSVAAHYALPSVNLALEVTDRIDAGEFSWENDFKDLHPSPFGQNIYFGSIRALLETCWERLPHGGRVSGHPLPDPIDRWSYAEGRYGEIDEVSSMTGWSRIDRWRPVDGKETRPGFAGVPVLASDTPGSRFEFRFSGTAAGICVAAGPDAGMVEYSVDGGEVAVQDLFTPWSGFLHLPWYYVLADQLDQREHTLTVRLSGRKNPGSIGRACRIVHFLVNGVR